ncbi:MAG: histidine kinase [Actinomycetia bacterium]|jgi:anti-sigma regulatory factor (Ser/Thr protein kinase)|nr:histidine kinase [Actinomycetes bacterium]MDQ1659927.1 hypothetical protein [Cryptosporangiaceae bacterium]
MEFRLELPPESGARPAWALVRRALTAWDVEDPGVTIQMVVTELIENVHQHTGGGGELCLALDGGEILVQVSDTSPALPAPEDPPSGRAAGRGLRLVRALTKDWGAEPRSTGKVVWARLSVADLADPASAAEGRAPCQLG